MLRIRNGHGQRQRKTSVRFCVPLVCIAKRKLPVLGTHAAHLTITSKRDQLAHRRLFRAATSRARVRDSPLLLALAELVDAFCTLVRLGCVKSRPNAASAP